MGTETASQSSWGDRAANLLQNVQEDHKVTFWEEFQDFLKTMQLKGFGGTGFRPVFQYVDGLRRKEAPVWAGWCCRRMRFDFINIFRRYLS